MNEIIENKPNQTVDRQAQMMTEYLDSVGLPHENIIATREQREKIGAALPTFIQELSPEVKRKATVYGLDIFFDTTVGASRNRPMYQNEDDLFLIKDATLVAACLKLELIREVTYFKLKHILDMRNHVGILHPSDYNIGAFELLGWLETCVKDVLQDQPTDDSLKAKQFIKNIKSKTDPIDDALLNSLKERFSSIPTHFSASILRTIFGIYIAETTSPIARQNIAKMRLDTSLV